MNGFVLGIVALTLAGCSSTKVFHSAFEDITQETRSTVGDFSTYRQLITLNGLMPMHVPGMLFYEPTASWVPNWFPSWLQPRESPGLLVGISPKRSMVVEARYVAKEPDEAVAKAQDAYQTLRNKAVLAVAARLKVALLETLSQAMDEKDEERIRALTRQLNFTQDKPSAQDIATMKKTATEEAERLRGELYAAQAAFSSKLGPNIMVARWTKKEGFQGVAKIFDLIGLGAGREYEESGVVILAGIKVLNTFLGEDLFCMVRNARHNPAQWEHMKRVSITVNMIQAQAVGYVSDVDVASTLALSLDISKEQLSRLLKDRLLDAAGAGARIKAETLVSTAMGVSNVGRMVDPAVAYRKTRFYPAVEQIEELQEELDSKRGAPYVTVSVTRAQFTESMLQGLAAAATDKICSEELEPQRTLTETVARAKRRIEISASEASHAMAAWKDNPGHHKLIREELIGTVEGMRNVLVRCADRIAQIDGEVSDALRNAMNASSDADAKRLGVRIASLKREQAAGPILAELKGISEGIYDIREKVRRMDKRMQEPRDPQKEIEEVASVFGVKASGFKVAPTKDLVRACGGA
ncbi:MAG TPA: hypothetical protein VJ797_02340 [Burkholderiales bacterium]|nr:hypothetical protein [Burkholderiales bacterium]